jgi:hypothetical protein|tara:strand:- start:2940 stop:4016 length:1077 start_codon:yes stop_codon:yes gene_type:complete
MTLPASGLITLGDINEELGRSRTAAIQLDKAENGDYGTINTCSPSYPNGANPAKISEWYDYNHNAVCSYSTKSCLFPPDDGNSGSMLYGDGWSSVSEEQPKFNDDSGGFSYGAWLLPRSEGATYYYMSAFHNYNNQGGGTVGGGWNLNIFNTSDGKTTLYFQMIDESSPPGGPNTTTWVYELNNSANTSTTGIATDRQWGVGTALYANNISIPLTLGNVNANNFMRLDITYDSSATGASRLNVYWNGTALTRTSGGTHTLNNITWDQQYLVVGGSYSSELGSGLCWDEVTYFYENCLSSTEVNEIYNSGAPQDEGNYSFSYTNVLFRFEDEGDLGLDTNGAYNLSNQVGTPASSTQHA